jgi:hypothetical protein
METTFTFRCRRTPTLSLRLPEVLFHGKNPAYDRSPTDADFIYPQTAEADAGILSPFGHACAVVKVDGVLHFQGSQVAEFSHSPEYGPHTDLLFAPLYASIR